MAKFNDYPRYIPVLKWQDWEQRALEKIDPTLLERVLPCIEVRTKKQHENLLSNVQTIWSNDVLVDYSNPSGDLTGGRLKQLMAFLSYASVESLPVAPVLSPGDVIGMKKPLKAMLVNLRSVAVRLRLNTLTVSAAQLQLVRDAYVELQAANIAPTLIIDFGVSPNSWEESEVVQLGIALNEINSIGFDSVHLLSGAYPASLASVKTGVARFDRNDWAFWMAVNSEVPELTVGYADYGTLSPEWTEDVLIRRGTRAVIRYTRDDDWLILRADGNKISDSEAISTILVSAYAKDFKGAGYSFGDDLIEERADPASPSRCGHYHITEGWSHHIAHVLKEQY